MSATTDSPGSHPQTFVTSWIEGAKSKDLDAEILAAIVATTKDSSLDEDGLLGRLRLIVFDRRVRHK
jgi:hypothetical protein